MSTLPTFVILVAEDDEDDRFLLTQAFARHQPGCHLEFFTNGQQLLDFLTKLAPAKLPALILLDLNMPELDGFSALLLLKSNPQLKPIPVVMLTTSDHPADIKRCYEAGANAYMTKPTTFAGMARQIDQTIDYWLKTIQLPKRS